MQDRDYYKKKSADKIFGREKTEPVIELENYFYHNDRWGKSIFEVERIHRIRGWKVINLEMLFELTQDSASGLAEDSYIHQPIKRKPNE